MADKLGSDVIKLQKEIMNITQNINTVRDKTHKSMSSILKGLKSFQKFKSSDLSSKRKIKNQKANLENDRFYSNFNKSHATTTYLKNPDMKKKKNSFITMNEVYSNPNTKRNIINYKSKIDNKNIPKKINGNILNEYDNYYNKKDEFSKSHLLLEKYNKYNKPIKFGIKNNYNNDIANDDNYIINYNRLNKKKMAKTDSYKFIYNNSHNYNNNNFSNDYIYYNQKENMYNKYYISESDNTDYNNTKEFRHNAYINKLLKSYDYKNPKKIIKSRNKDKIERNFKIDNNNDDELIDYRNYLNGKSAKTFHYELIRKCKNINNRNSLINHKNKKNIFREKASTKHNSKEKNSDDDDEYYQDNNHDKNNDNIKHILKLLKAKNQLECINKINKLLSYEDFVHKIKKIYCNYNDNNKSFKLKDILFWISINYNNKKINKYEEFCLGIMKKFNISNFDNFKIFFKNLIAKDKNNEYFVNEMKELFNNFNEFQPNKTIYRNKSCKKIENATDNEDDINNIL